jgi:MoaA/NifB/PqqE/SkfB family radical SAM enzyme
MEDILKAKLTPEGMSIYIPEKHTTIRLESLEEIEKYTKVKLKNLPTDYPGPEIVHLEISDRCNLSCPYCYVGKKQAKELPTGAWLRIIRKLADASVYQITFGGGEPTMRDDVVALAAYAKEKGLNVAMTSNGINIPKYSQADLKYFDQINISFHLSAPDGTFTKALQHLQDNGIKRGINFCLSKDYEEYLAIVLGAASAYSASLLVLTYKPVIGDYENQIPPEEVMATMKAISASNFDIFVDGLTCQKCMGSKRFCDISSVGDVYPCSFIRTPQGNVLTEEFDTIWKNRIKEVACPYLKK